MPIGKPSKLPLRYQQISQVEASSMKIAGTWNELFCEGLLN
jgi:hypothetical protein